MSRAVDEVVIAMDRYLSAMKAAGKTPKSITLTKKQYAILASVFGGKDFKPRYKGIEVKRQ